MLRTGRLTFLQLAIFSLPIFLGLGLGFLIVKGNWVYALVLAMMAPLVILFSQRPFIGVILWLVLMPLSSALPNPELMYWAIHRILIPFTLVMTILPRLISGMKLPRVRMGLPELSIALMAAYIPISLMLSGIAIRQPLIKYIDRLLIPFCMYLIIRFTALRSSELRLLQWTTLFIAASQSMIGFVSLTAAHILPYAWRPVLQGYTAGSLLNPNVFAVVLGFCICLLFQAAMDHRSGFDKSIFIVTSGVSVIGIFLSMERAAWLAGALVLLGLLVLYPKIMLRFLLIAAVFLLVLGGIFLSKYSSRVADRISNQGTINDRIVVTDAMLQMIQDKPIWGWGYETLNQNIAEFYRQVGTAYVGFGLTTSHNTYLTIFTELGLFGFLMYMLPAFWLLADTFRAWRGEPKIDLARWLLLATFSLAALQNIVVSNFMDMRFFPIGLTLWWMTLGLIANLLNQHAEVRDRHLAYKAAQNWRQAPPFDPLLLENNGTKGN